jgi:calcium/calmodulin-dependent protein kinase I
LACWKDEKYAYLATEYCPGGELFEQVSNRGALPEEEVKKHIRGVLAAVEHLHSHGIGHRDISLENILLGDDGCVRLIDLGSAHQLYDTRSGENVPARGMVGKDMYRAPEMYHIGKHGRASYAADKADMWEVAQCAVIMLCGRPLWVHPNEEYEPNGSFRFVSKHGLPKLFEQWGLRFSKDASEFIQSLSHLDPMMRPSAREALGHPWLSTASRPVGDFP